MVTDEFKTIATTSEGYYTEKRSKFLAFAHHVETVDEIKELLASYRKKYYDARHVCYAYMLGAGREEFRANDDGEPSSTAGKPILGQINSNELTDILIVVVRYYGGVNLGTSGLIVAYREAAADAIAHATIEMRQVEEVITYTFAYPQMNDVMRIVKEMNPRILSQTYDNTCEIRLSIRQSEAEQLRNRLSNSFDVFVGNIFGSYLKKYYLCIRKSEKEGKEGWQSDRMRWTRNPVYPFRVSGV